MDEVLAALQWLIEVVRLGQVGSEERQPLLGPWEVVQVPHIVLSAVRRFQAWLTAGPTHSMACCQQPARTTRMIQRSKSDPAVILTGCPAVSRM